MDAEAFDRLFTARYPVLVGHVTAMWGDPDAAADAVQEAFVRAWTKRREFGRHPHPDAWIRTVARNLLTDGWRRRRRHAPLDHEPAVTGPDAAEWISLQRALRELPPNQRDAIVLHYLADLPVARVAEELDAQPGTVRVWLSRGRDRLGVLLDEDKEPRHA